MNKLQKFIWLLKRPSLYKYYIELRKKNNAAHGIEKELEPQIPSYLSKELSRQEFIDKFISNYSKYDVTGLKEEITEAETSLGKNVLENFGGAGDYTLLFLLANHIKAKSIIETGVALGYSSFALLKVAQHNDGCLNSTDRPYLFSNYDKYVGALVPKELHKYWNLIKKPDKYCLANILAGTKKIDLAHYDSDKSVEGRLWAYNLIWPKIRDGGVFISDDIGDNNGFDLFCDSIDVKPIIVRSGNKYVGIIFK